MDLKRDPDLPPGDLKRDPNSRNLKDAAPNHDEKLAYHNSLDKVPRIYHHQICRFSG